MAPNLTLAGLPVQHWLSTQRGADALALEVIEGVRGAKERVPGDVWATLALLVVHWHAAHHRPLSPQAVEALQAVLAPALDSPEVKARLGLPTGASAHEMEQLLLAAQLDGEAMAAGGAKLHREALGPSLLVSGRTIDAWRKLPEYEARLKYVAGTAGPVVPAVPRGIEPQRQWIRDREKRRDEELEAFRTALRANNGNG